jgi:hypothetical protein
MPMLRRVRLIAAIVLVCAIVLPLSECQKGHSYQPVKKTISNELFPQDNSDFLYYYGYEALGSPLGATLTGLAFAWPLIFLLSVRKRVGFRLRLSLQLLELLLCAGTIYWVHALTMGGRWLYGFYVSIIAVAVFTCAGLASWFIHTRDVAEGSLTNR